MDSKVRKGLYAPLSAGTLSAIVPELHIKLRDREAVVPALLTSNKKEFTFSIHFTSVRPPDWLVTRNKQYFTRADQLTIAGELDGEFAFQCRDIFPPAGGTFRSPGTSSIELYSKRLELVAHGADVLTSLELDRLLKGARQKKGAGTSFSAHIIFDGPKLRIRDSGSETKRQNDFLGKAVSSTFDTHMFAGEDYEAALIQKDQELHLHVRSKDNARVRRPPALIDRIVRSVAFAFGFHPWPSFREVRIDHRIYERWICPKFELPQTFLAPISEALWASYFGDKNNPLYRIIPTVEAGMRKQTRAERNRIETLLWHVRSSDFSQLPHSTKMLILCSAMDGLLQVITGTENEKDRLRTDRLWRKACEELRLSWEKWMSVIFKLRGRHRHDLSHGRLWVSEDRGFEDFQDYAQLGCAFMTIIAARCGYEGPILADPYKPRKAIISDLKTTG